MKRWIHNERGVAMITVLGIMLMLGLLGTAMVNTSTQESNISDNFRRDTQALYGSEAAATYAEMIFSAVVDSTDMPPDPLPTGSLSLNGQKVSYMVYKEPGGPYPGTMSTGMYRGLSGYMDHYDIWGKAVAEATGVTNAVRIRMTHAFIPVFQFAIFYNDDLEWHPGDAMTLAGRVHANGNLYVGSDNGLTVNSYVTAAKGLFHGRHPDAGLGVGHGFVRVKDQLGVDKDMENVDGTWLDHDEANWYDESTTRWGGQVQDIEHGIKSLDIPLTAGTDPYNLIKDKTGGNTDSFEHKADLKILNGKAYFNVAGVWTDVTAAMITDGSLAAGAFFDAHEGKTVTSLDIDMDQLGKSKFWPPNGIVYTKSTVGTYPVTRLVNGGTILAPFTLASANPVYTLGNFNTFKKQPVAILADAYTVLSSGWSDLTSADPLGSRVAGNTTVNASFITGNVPSAGGTYSGGVENLPRFLEKWTGRTFTWRGSMIQLWKSKQAITPWASGVYYTPPKRDWDYDTDLMDLSKMPPGTPTVNAVVKEGWLNSDELPPEIATTP